MNERAVTALVSAAMEGRRQIVGRISDYDGGACALGVIGEVQNALGGMRDILVPACPFCGATKTWTGGETKGDGFEVVIRNEVSLVIHLNNDHGWDFLTIARKLGSSPAGVEP